jgi:hypothetical protein
MSRRRYPSLSVALLVLSVIGCSLTGCTPDGSATQGGTTAMAPDYQPSTIVLTPSPSIPDAQTFTHWFRVTKGVGTLAVDDKIGNVTINGSDRSSVEIMAFATYSSVPPVITRTVSGGTLTVGYTCPAQVPCRVTFDIWMPSFMAVNAATDTGSIWLNNLAGAAAAKVGAGYIFASGLTGQTASFSTDAGGITAAFASPPEAVTASTVFGLINLQVPVTVTYRMITNVIGGSVTVSVPLSTGAARTIAVSTNLGNVHVTPSQL